jgi:hypothetical protein
MRFNVYRALTSTDPCLVMEASSRPAVNDASNGLL